MSSVDQGKESQLPDSIFECFCGVEGDVFYKGDFDGSPDGFAICPRCGKKYYLVNCPKCETGWSLNSSNSNLSKDLDLIHQKWRCDFCNEWHSLENAEKNEGTVKILRVGEAVDQKRIPSWGEVILARFLVIVILSILFTLIAAFFPQVLEWIPK